MKPVPIQSPGQLHYLLEVEGLHPDLLIVGNFPPARQALARICGQQGIDRIHSEDGFFPHYTTLHLDPLGFCWESSLPRLGFVSCPDSMRRRARTFRRAWTDFRPRPLPDFLCPPFALWPLQLIRDQVNCWDLKAESWAPFLWDFRARLPDEMQLVVKAHPRAGVTDMEGIAAAVRAMPHTVMVSTEEDLKSLLVAAAIVGGINSTVLYEARLLFGKPVFVYGHGWFSGHPDLFTPLIRSPRCPDPLPVEWEHCDRGDRAEFVAEYADWFLAHLLVRQVSHAWARRYPDRLRERVEHFTYQAYCRHGEALFTDMAAAPEEAQA